MMRWSFLNCTICALFVSYFCVFSMWSVNFLEKKERQKMNYYTPGNI